PDFVPTAPVDALGSRAFGARRAAMIDRARALPRPLAAIEPGSAPTGGPRRITNPPWPPRLAGTRQMAAADPEGHMGSLLTSISAGSYVAVPETGVILNNGMNNFDPRPGRPNSIAPGKMPIFAVPTLVAVAENGRAVFAAGGSGGYRITTAILHPLVHWHDFKMSLADAVAAPRVHCQGKDTYVDERIAPDVRAALAALGHRVVVQGDSPGLNAYGRVPAVAFDPSTGLLSAACGPPWLGAAGGLLCAY